MSRIKSPETVSKETMRIFDEIRGAFGMVPNLFRTYAVHPPLLQANWNKVKAVMMQGSLSAKVKQTIAVLVSKDNSCKYCVAAHRGALKSIGISDEELKRIEENIEKADFTVKERALINFARKANQDPIRIPDSDFEALRQSGASDPEIIEALGVMEVFTSFNKFLDSLQVDIDF
ncbi:MAG: peroxidase-related enzyme [Nitrospirae bacterium]|nr:peroxidase-related enzyme [Nitrospirota bacterium]